MGDRFITWADYGISKERYAFLVELLRNSGCDCIQELAEETDHFISKYLVKSVTEGLSFDDLERQASFDGKIIPINRTDFYGKRRALFHRVDVWEKVTNHD